MSKKINIRLDDLYGPASFGGGGGGGGGWNSDKAWNVAGDTVHLVGDVVTSAAAMASTPEGDIFGPAIATTAALDAAVTAHKFNKDWNS